MKKITAVILAVLSAAIILSACAKKNPAMPLASMPAALVLATTAPTPAAGTPTPTPQPQALLLVDNCDGDTNQNQLKGLWASYDDNSPPNYGNSTVSPQKGGNFTMSYVTDWIFPPPGTYSPTWPATNVYAARLSGVLNLKAKYNLIGMMTGMNFTETPVNLSGYKQLIFWAKVGQDDMISERTGNDHSPNGAAGYRFSLVSYNNPSTSGYDMYGVSINPPATWTQYVCNFSATDPEDFGITFGTPIGWYDGDPNDGIPAINGGLGAISHVTDLEMQTKTSATSNPLAVDLWIDSIYLVRAD